MLQADEGELILYCSDAVEPHHIAPVAGVLYLASHYNLFLYHVVPPALAVAKHAGAHALPSVHYARSPEEAEEAGRSLSGKIFLLKNEEYSNFREILAGEIDYREC